METLDSGKPLAESREDITEVAFMFEYYGGWATKVHGETIPLGPDAMSIVVKEPVGVVAAIPPWNYPMMMATQKVAPALAVGCTAILKPASYTPQTGLAIGRILEEAGCRRASSTSSPAPARRSERRWCTTRAWTR